MLRVSDLMTREVKSVEASTPMDEVYEIMTDLKVRHVPVVDGENELCGLISHRDVMTLLGELSRASVTRQNKLLADHQACDVMVRTVETVHAEEALSAAAETLFENKLGCLVVVSGQHIDGILTEADFVRFVAHHAA